MTRPEASSGLSPEQATEPGATFRVAPRVPEPASLVARLQAGDPALAPFYAGHPGDAAAYERKAAEVAERLPAAARRAAGAAIRATTPAAAARLERILAGQGYFVTTGQQTGLFGGPLFVAHKILTAVRLAAALEERLGQPVAPLFWVASEDHDFREIASFRLLDRTESVRTIRLPDAPEAPPVAMARRLLGQDVNAAVEALAAQLPDTPWSGELLDVVRGAYRPDATVAEAFTELVAHVFAPFDLCIVEAHHPALKAASVPVLGAALTEAGRDAAAVGGQSARLAAAGFREQVAVEADAANLLFEDEHGRERLVRDGRGWALRRTNRVLEAERAVALLQAEPWRFSPNVHLRPVVESALLPTVCYVGGPAEVSYFAQIGCLFHAHGVAPPVVRPRASLDVIERAAYKVLRDYGLTPADFAAPFERVAKQVARRDMPEDVLRAEAALEAALREGYAALHAAALEIDPNVEGPVLHGLNVSLSALERVRDRLATHLKRADQVKLARLGRAAAHLWPDGQPQERALGFLPYVARYGPAFLEGVAAAIHTPLDAAAPAWRGVECQDG